MDRDGNSMQELCVGHMRVAMKGMVTNGHTYIVSLLLLHDLTRTLDPIDYVGE